jgi:hypothetical protein
LVVWLTRNRASPDSVRYTSPSAAIGMNFSWSTMSLRLAGSRSFDQSSAQRDWL